MVDVIGFLSLGKLFTAHVTGNLVVIAALLVRGGPPNMAQILAVPVFIGAVGAVWLIAKAFDRRGLALARPLLLVQCLLLTCVLIVSAIYNPAAHPHGLMAGVAAMIAVAAMACQFALLRLTVPGAPSTTVMTGNVTNTVLSLLDTLSRSEPLMEGANERLKKTFRARRRLLCRLHCGRRSGLMAERVGLVTSGRAGWGGGGIGTGEAGVHQGDVWSIRHAVVRLCLWCICICKTRPSAFPGGGAGAGALPSGGPR